MNESDEKLITAAKEGDVEAFGELFERYKDAVYSFIYKSVRRREDAEDIVQEAFCRAWKSIGRFRGDSRFLTWICRIAANLCADAGRSARNITCSASDPGINFERLKNHADQSADIQSESITRQAINHALGQLHISHRMLIILCDIQGFSCSEAAEVLECSQISVRVRLVKARKRLRGLLTGVLEEVD